MLTADSSLEALVQVLDNRTHSRKTEAVLRFLVLYETVPPTAVPDNQRRAKEAVVSSQNTEGPGQEGGRRR